MTVRMIEGEGRIERVRDREKPQRGGEGGVGHRVLGCPPSSHVYMRKEVLSLNKCLIPSLLRFPSCSAFVWPRPDRDTCAHFRSRVTCQVLGEQNDKPAEG